MSRSRWPSGYQTDSQFGPAGESIFVTIKMNRSSLASVPVFDALTLFE
jgi:hypothetical protein